MKIYYEDSLPYAAEFFAGLGDSQVFSHKDVNGELVADADVLLVRSTTKVNAELLKANQNIKYVGTATAGTNHLDKDYLRSRGLGCSVSIIARKSSTRMIRSNWKPARLSRIQMQ